MVGTKPLQMNGSALIKTHSLAHQETDIHGITMYSSHGLRDNTSGLILELAVSRRFAGKEG